MILSEGCGFMFRKNIKWSFLIIIGIGAIWVVLFALGFNLFLVHSGSSMYGSVETVALSEDDSFDSSFDNLDVIVYLNGNEEPVGGVSAQFSIAVINDIAKRVFNKDLVGRVFVSLDDHYGESGGYVWNVTGEVDGGLISGTIDAINGVDLRCSYFPSSGDHSWDWFDNWSFEKAEKQRIYDESNFSSSIELSSEEDENMAQIKEAKKAVMLKYSEDMASSLYDDKGLELVNILGIGNGVSASVMMDGAIADGNGSMISVYIVEVLLDDGSFVVVELGVGGDDMSLLGYTRSDASMVDIY